MIKKTKSLIFMSIIAISADAISKEIGYDYVQGTYNSITDDSLGVDIDGSGFSVSGSFSLSPNIALTALFGSTNYDRIAGLDIDANEFNFGITAHTSVAPNTDIFGTFAIVNGEVEVSDGYDSASDDDSGNSITVGLRHMVTDSLEISAGLSRLAIFDETSNAAGFGVRFYAGEKVSFGVGYSSGDDVETLSLGARVDFK